jgi:hypothetical protein
MHAVTRVGSAVQVIAVERSPSKPATSTSDEVVIPGAGGRPGVIGSPVRAILDAVRTAALLSVSVLLAGCGGESVVVSGDVQYDAHKTGDIVLRLVEDETCQRQSCRTPGETIASTRLREPGPFVLEGKADDQAQYIHLLGYALGEATDSSNCEAGGMETFDVTDQRDVVLALQPGVCPALH